MEIKTIPLLLIVFLMPAILIAGENFIAEVYKQDTDPPLLLYYHYNDYENNGDIKILSHYYLMPDSSEAVVEKAVLRNGTLWKYNARLLCLLMNRVKLTLENDQLSIIYNNEGKIIYAHGATANTGNLGFHVASAEKVRIDTGGNVGIGTTNPERNLVLYRTNYPTFQLVDSTTGSTSGDGTYLQQFGNDFYLINQEPATMNFGTANGADMTIDSSGNVGIGTASPDEKLQIDGNFTSETNATDSIGTLAIQWLNGFFVDLFVSNDLEVGGDVNVTGYIGGKNYVTQYHKNATIDTTSADTWVNISWDLTIDEETTSGYSLTDSNVSITIENTGIYRIQGCLHPKK